MVIVSLASCLKLPSNINIIYIRSRYGTVALLFAVVTLWGRTLLRHHPPAQRFYPFLQLCG